MKKKLKAALAAVLTLCLALAAIPVSALPSIEKDSEEWYRVEPLQQTDIDLDDKTSTKTNPELKAPEGYDSHDYNKCVQFLEQTNADGIKNGISLCGNVYDPNNPSTWWFHNHAWPIFLWRASEQGNKRLTSIDVQGFMDTHYVAGDMDFSGCTKLFQLYCNSNDITSLNVEGCSSLKKLVADGNQIAYLDVSGCSILEEISINVNRLTELNVSGFSNLTELYCKNNQIKALDLSGCTAIKKLHCSNNRIKELDISSLMQLEALFCENNRFDELDVSNSTMLKSILCTGLKELDLSNNPQLPLKGFKTIGKGRAGLTYYTSYGNLYASLNAAVEPYGQFVGWYNEDDERISTSTQHFFDYTDTNAEYTARFDDVDVNVWDFETSPMQIFSTLDSDGDGNNWSWKQNDYSSHFHEGNGYVRSYSRTSNGEALTPDNWLITPEFYCTSFSFWAQVEDASRPGEYLGIYVSNDDGETWSDELAGFSLTGQDTQYSVDLSAYSGQLLRIAFRHYNSTDLSRINLDYIETVNDADDQTGYIDGTFEYTSTITEKTASYGFEYYDGWFRENNFEYNHDLAQMSIRTAMAGAQKNGDNIRRLYNKLSYKNISINYPTPTENSIGSAIAMKNYKDISIIAITVRGGGYEAEWADNGRVGTTIDHEGFNNAAQQIENRLAAYIAEHGDKLKRNVKIWICGFSRAGAVTNLAAAKHLVRTYSCPQNSYDIHISSSDVFAFCFECPNTTRSGDASDYGYAYIHSFVNPIDFVPMVPLADWGFTRYGNTHYFPAAGMSKNYKSFKAGMKNTYDLIISYANKDRGASDEYTSEWIGQNSILTNAAKDLASAVSYNLYHKIQTDVMNLLKTYFGKPKFSKDGQSFFERLAWLIRMRMYWVVDFVKVGLMAADGTLMKSHYPELCLAWLDSIAEDCFYTNPRKSIFSLSYFLFGKGPDAPFDVDVYDEEGNLAASYRNGELSIFDEAVSALTDEEGKLSFILPADGYYEAAVNATGSADVSISMIEYSGDCSDVERVVAYNDLHMDSGDTAHAYVEVLDETDEPYALVLNDEELTPDIDLGEGDTREHTIDIEVEGCGIVNVGGTFATGEYARLKVDFNEANFLGWYVGEELLSNEAEYRFMVAEDMFITAKFSTPFGDVNLDGTISIADTILIARHALELIELEAPCDLNKDYSVTIADAILSARYVLGLMQS